VVQNGKTNKYTNIQTHIQTHTLFGKQFQQIRRAPTAGQLKKKQQDTTLGFHTTHIHLTVCTDLLEVGNKMMEVLKKELL